MWNLKLLSVNFHILSQNLVFSYSLNGYLPVCGFVMVFVPHLKNGSLNYTDLPNVNTFYYVIFLKIIIITITNKLIWKACKCWEVVKLTGVHKYQFLLESSNFVISYFPWSSRLALSNFEKIFAKCSSPSNHCLSVVLSSKFGVSLLASSACMARKHKCFSWWQSLLFMVKVLYDCSPILYAEYLKDVYSRLKL